MNDDFHRIRRLPPYVFAHIDPIKAKARANGVDVIDLGMGNPDMPTPQHIVDKLQGDGERPAHPPLFLLQGHPGPAQGPGELLRPPLRREAESRHPDRCDARLQGRLRQHGVGHHRARRRGAGAQPDLSDPLVRLHHEWRRRPLHAGRPERGFHALARSGRAALDPQADRAGAELSGQPDRLHGDARFLQGGRRLLQGAQHLHPLRSRLFRDLFRRRGAALGARSARRHRHHRRVHLDVQDLLDARLARRLCRRQ